MVKNRLAALNTISNVLPRRLVKLLRNRHSLQQRIQRNVRKQKPAKLRRQHPTNEARHDENAREWRLEGIGYFAISNVSAE